MLKRDFKECVASFNAHGVEYMVVGGYALAAHGRPRYTGDIDFWIRATEANAARVLAALADFVFASVIITLADLTQQTKTFSSAARRAASTCSPPSTA